MILFSMKPEKLLLIYTHYSSFVATDEQILSSHFQVTTYRFKPARGAFAAVLALIRQFFFLALNIRKFDLLYVWFADQHSLLPVLFARLTGRHCFLVIGGYDVCRIETLNYGVFCSKARGFAAINSMKMSTLNLAVSNYVARKVKALSRRNNLDTVYNCVNLTPPGWIDPANRALVLTVAFVDSERTFLLKGLDTFIETARLLPDLPFTIIGFDENKLSTLRRTFPGNISIVASIPHEQLPDYYRKTKIYCQLSRVESFGIALAESILYGCLPLVTREGGMPEIVSDKENGVKRDPFLIAAKIRKFYSSPGNVVQLSEKFTLDHRRKDLFHLLKSS